MDEIATNLGSPAWWFSVVIVGIAVGALGGFVKDWAANVLSSVFASVAQWNARRLHMRESRIEIAASDWRILQLRYHELAHEHRLRIDYFLFTVFFLTIKIGAWGDITTTRAGAVVPFVIPLVLALSIVLYVLAALRYQSLRAVVRTATRRFEERRGPPAQGIGPAGGIGPAN